MELKYDIGYIGNLYNPNNVYSLKWFLEKIFPIVKNEIPNLQMVIAGSKPSKQFLTYCSKFTGLTIISNPKSVNEYYKGSKVLINPTLFGSGVNIKSIEMLHFDKHVVCTNQAIAGLPEKFREVFHVSEEPEKFAKIIINILKNKMCPLNLNKMNELKYYFSQDYIKDCLVSLTKKLDRLT